MPEFAGLSHVSLSVRDRDASRAWYEDVMGFRMAEESNEDAYDEWILLHPDTKVILCLQQHKANRGEEFDPARTGGDHVGFKVDDREALDEWERWFEKKGVVHTPTVDRAYGSVLCFKDCDGFQLEMFHRENHP
ncbi:MAG TPA: VOC family protein [Acidimicrobiales bacterium]|nr:VOC family protein [Acidimicrobiales bacterium]